jgi:glycine cleavage system H protein
MAIMKDRLYTREHEWVRREGGRAYVGISDHAQEAMGAIVFVELPAVGKALAAGEACAVVESVKAASNVYTPVAGTVAEVNAALDAQPELLNESPYEAWMVCLDGVDAMPEGLMDADAYEAFLAQEG